MNDPVEDFRLAMRQVGLEHNGPIVQDGHLHRFKSGEDKDAASWYVYFADAALPAGAFGCWRRQINQSWCQQNGSKLSDAERKALRGRWDKAEADRRTETEKLASEAKQVATRILSAGAVPTSAHPYLRRKGIGVYGEMRVDKEDCLIVPLRDIKGALTTVEWIAPDKRFDGRDKKFLWHGRKRGSFYEISDDPEGALLICEGYATGASLYESTKLATVCAMDAGNLLFVAQEWRKKQPKRLIVIAADNDRFTEGNPGIVSAEKAARAIKAAVAIPEFSDEDTQSSDFNDLADISGQIAVKRTIEAAIKEFLLPKFETLPKVDNATDLVSDTKLVPPPQLIEGLLHQGLKGVLGSNSKARKSWILLDLAISVASGKDFWTWPTHQGRVLLINFEIPRAFMRFRIDTVCHCKGVRDIGALDVWTLRGYAAALWKLLPDMVAQIRYGGYALVVIDPIYKTLGGRDENAAGDIAQLCNEMEKLAVETGAAVFYAAHFSKGNQASKEAIDRIGGSGVFARDPDSIITLTKHEEEDAYTVDLVLRNLPETPSFVVRWNFPLMDVDPQLDPKELKQAAGGSGRRRKVDLECMAMLLSEKSLLTGDWKKMAATELGISTATFFRMRDELVQQKRVMQSPVLKRWELVLRPEEKHTRQEKFPNQSGD